MVGPHEWHGDRHLKLPMPGALWWQVVKPGRYIMIYQDKVKLLLGIKLENTQLDLSGELSDTETLPSPMNFSLVLWGQSSLQIQIFI